MAAIEIWALQPRYNGIKYERSTGVVQYRETLFLPHQSFLQFYFVQICPMLDRIPKTVFVFMCIVAYKPRAKAGSTRNRGLTPGRGKKSLFSKMYK
jgi:hypothetical protein